MGRDDRRRCIRGNTDNTLENDCENRPPSVFYGVCAIAAEVVVQQQVKRGGTTTVVSGNPSDGL